MTNSKWWIDFQWHSKLTNSKWWINWWHCKLIDFQILTSVLPAPARMVVSVSMELMDTHVTVLLASLDPTVNKVSFVNPLLLHTLSWKFNIVLQNWVQWHAWVWIPCIRDQRNKFVCGSFFHFFFQFLNIPRVVVVRINQKLVSAKLGINFTAGPPGLTGKFPGGPASKLCNEKVRWTC